MQLGRALGQTCDLKVKTNLCNSKSYYHLCSVKKIINISQTFLVQYGNKMYFLICYKMTRKKLFRVIGL